MSPCSSSSKLAQLYPEQKYKKLRRKYRKWGKLFEDELFPPSGLLLSRSTSGEDTISYFRSSCKIKDVQWLRPHEIVSRLQCTGRLPPDAVPVMESGLRNRFDVNQGELGDCWFLAPLALLAESKLFSKVVPAGQGFGSGYCGIFKFRFYRLGEWVEVVVDDRLPTRDGQLIYLRGSASTEFWSPLLEKAYAKLNGSYAALEGGVSIHAAVDFTGGIPRMVDFENKPQDPKELYHLLKLTYKNHGLITCALAKRHTAEAGRLGLQGNHSYSVTKVVEVWNKKTKENIPLVRLRNPHGNDKEWVGDWSDSSALWTNISKRKRRKIDLEVESDGEFYIGFNTDFVRFFGSIDLVHVNPIRMELTAKKVTRKFHMLTMRSRWELFKTAGGIANISINPRFMFSLTRTVKSGKDCSVIVSLAQEVLHYKEEHHIGFRIYKYSEDEDLQGPNFFNNGRNLAGSSGTYINSREISENFQLEEGKYCIVPSTYTKNQVAQFHLRVYVEYRWRVESPNKIRAIRDKNCFFWCCQSFIRCTCCYTYCYSCCSRTKQTNHLTTTIKHRSTAESTDCCNSRGCCGPSKGCCSRGCCGKNSADGYNCCLRPSSPSRSCCNRGNDDYYRKACETKKQGQTRNIPIQRLNKNFVDIERSRTPPESLRLKSEITRSLLPRGNISNCSSSSGANAATPFRVYNAEVSKTTEVCQYYKLTDSKQTNFIAFSKSNKNIK